MGSDFCYAYLVMEKEKEADWKKAELLIEKLLGTHMSKWHEALPCSDIEYLFMKLNVALDGYKDESEPDMNDRTASCQKLKACLESVRKAWENGNREVGMIELKDVDIMLTGGLSWGDSPTDMYDVFNLFYECGLAHEAGFQC